MNKKNYLSMLLLAGLLLPYNSLYATIHTVNVGTGGAMSFFPDNLTVAAGDTIEWVYDDPTTMGHTTTSINIPSGAQQWDAPLDPGNTTYRYIPVVSGTYEYVCTPHSGMMTGQFTVTCVAPGTPSVTPVGPVTACEGDAASLTLHASSVPGVTYRWYRGSDSIPGATNMHYMPDTTGSYSCRVSNSCGSANSNTVSVTVNPSPAASFTFVPAGLTYTFTNTTPDAADWHWDFGDGDTSIQQHPVHTYAQAGNYTVTLTATNTANSCARSYSEAISPSGGTGLPAIHAAGFVISPNPASSDIRISALTGSISRFLLYDITGRAIGALPVIRQTATDIYLDVSRVPAGNYLLQITTTDNHTVTRPLSVSR